MTTQKQLHPNEYYAWTNMKTRCSNPNYSEFHRYGERGVTVCPEWQKSFKAFFAHIGPKPFPEAMLDRLDNSKGYEPGNIKWSSPTESSRNREMVKPVEAFGNNLLLPEWQEASGRCRKIIWRRLKQGWPPEMAIAAPPMPHRYRHKPNPIEAYEADWKLTYSHTVERMSCGKGLFAYRLIPNVKA